MSPHFIIFDCETGGLDNMSNPITQIAMIAIDSSSFDVLKSYETFIKPYDNLVYDPKALAYTGTTMDQINAGIPAEQAYTEIKDFICSLNEQKGRSKDKFNPILVGHNVSFDIGFLDYIFYRKDDELFKYANKNTLDTMALFFLASGNNKDQTKHTLTATTEYFNIEIVDAHDAMGDVKATTELLKVYGRLLRQGIEEGVQSQHQRFRESFVL